MSCANRFCVNFPTHRHQTRALVNARAKMAGFSCSAILALYLTAITFPEGDALSVNRDKATTSPSSNTSLAHVKTPTSIPTSNGYVQDQKPTASGNNDLYTEDSDMYKLRIEIIKAKILKKLQMDKQPVVHIEKTKDKMIADLLLSLNLIDMNDDDSETEEYEDRKYDKTSKLIVFGEKAQLSPSKSKRKFSEKLIFQFRIEPKSLSSLVPSAFLWVHKRKSRQHELRKKTLHIYAHDKESPRGTSKVPIRRTTKTKLKSKRTGSGWEMIDVKEIVRHWFNKTANQYDAGNGTGNGTDNGVQALEISCLDCDSNVSQLINSRGRLRPFLVIDLEKPRTLKRKKREDNGCPAGQAVSCCRRTFYVDFVKIGWDWVIHPQGFYANFCEGSCDSLHTRVTSERAIILQEAAKKNLGPPAYTGSCCSPTKMLPFSMLYWDDEYNIAKKDLQDLKVKECGCS